MQPTNLSPLPLDELHRLQRHARNIREHALRMGAVQGQGYIGQALGFADVLAALYCRTLRLRPAEPDWPGRDRCLLSMGHYAIALYAALMEARVLPTSEIATYGADNSRLPMSGMAPYTPGMEITGGSLGQGLPIAIGMALALRASRTDARVYNLLSDGELNEGSTWEAIQSASHWQLANLIAVVDVNNQQADGPSSSVLSFEPLEQRWSAFGWHTQRVDGNDIAAVALALDAARDWPHPQPRVVLCDTLMGKGVPFLESREKTHFIRVDEREWALALNALDAELGAAA